MDFIPIHIPGRALGAGSDMSHVYVPLIYFVFPSITTHTFTSSTEVCWFAVNAALIFHDSV